MAVRVAAHLPRLVVLGLVCLLAGATLTYGAAKRLSAPVAKRQAPVSAPTVVVPDVTGQAFVFAKGALEDSGFAWKVTGSVHGYAANRVVSQSPAAGTKLKDTGAPTVTVSLNRSSYAESGEPEDTSPYLGTPVVPVRPVVAPLPTPTPSTTRVVPTTHRVAPTHKVAAKPAARAPAFVVKGAPKEPLKEVPLPVRARSLSGWLSSHPKPTDANVRHFLYQNAWITTGAKFGWWHGAEAVKLLIAADQKAERLWGIGSKSELAARHVLAEVKARTR
jgi:hypothetical protein